MKIQILLSTYNGEKYLRPQLDSYLALTGVDELKVLIRDDGSTDGTLSILREYRDKYGFTVIEGENLGLNRRMYALVAARDKDCAFYAVSDQDDVWLPHKLSRAVEFVSESGSEMPILYAGTSYLVDEELAVKGRTHTPRKPLNFYNAMVENMCIGHTLVMNRALMDIYSSGYSEGIFVFDYWAYLLASSVGKVIFDKEPGTYYRQHGSNVIGYKASRIWMLKVRIKRVFTGKSYYNARQLSAFLETYGELIHEDHKKEACRFFAMQRSFFTRLGYIFITKAFRQGRGEGVIFRLMYLLGKYNFKKTSTKESNQ